MTSDQAMRASDRDRERASPGGQRDAVYRQPAGDHFGWRVPRCQPNGRDPSDSGSTGRHPRRTDTRPFGPRRGRCRLLPIPLALRGETVADRVWLVAPMNRTGSGQLNGEPLTPGNLLARRFGRGGGRQWSAPSVRQTTIAPSALERTATALGIKSHPPGEGEFRVAPVVDRGRLSSAFGLLSCTVNHHKDATLTKREADAIERAFLEVAVRSLAGDSSRSWPCQSARLTSVKIARTCEDYARKWRYQNVTLADLCEASGVSERRVRSAFYECYQMSLPPTCVSPRSTRYGANSSKDPTYAVPLAVPRRIGASGTSVGSLPNIGSYSASHPDTPSAIERLDPKQPRTELRSR